MRGLTCYGLPLTLNRIDLGETVAETWTTAHFRKSATII